MLPLEENELKSIDQKTQLIVSGFLRNAMVLSKKNDDDHNDNDNDIMVTCLLYYHDKLILNTNILYPTWDDIELLTDNSSDMVQLRKYYNKIISLYNYNDTTNKLPLYELIRYYFGVTRDMKRALSKYSGSIEIYKYYNINKFGYKSLHKCLNNLSKSCHFCGYHNKMNKLSPVFVLDYSTLNWNEFKDISLLICACFYIATWMSDNIEYIRNGITLMVSCRGVKFRDLKKCLILLRAIQKALVLRTNNVFFLDLPSIAKNSIQLFLKIYPKEIQERIHIYSDTKELFKKLEFNEIPEIFGGGLINNTKTNLSEILKNYLYVKNFNHFNVKPK